MHSPLFLTRPAVVKRTPCVAVMLAVMLAACATRPVDVGQAGRGKGASSPVSATQAQAPAAVVTPPAPLPPVAVRDPSHDGAPLAVAPEPVVVAEVVPQVEPIRSGGANKPYVVQGQTFEPTTSDASFKQRGVASWYGTKFHGRRTASGELFNVYALTAAHRTLPIPSYARVRRVATGKEIIVRINDRGPFVAGRIIDLSYAAATKLGISGVGEVEIERLTFEDIRTGAWRRDAPAPSDAALTNKPNTANGNAPTLGETSMAMGVSDEALTNAAAPNAPASAPLAVTASATVAQPVRMAGMATAYTTAAKGYWVQLAALGRRDGIEKLQEHVAGELQTLAPLLAVFHEAALFKLQAGPYVSRQQAQAAAQQAAQTLHLSPMVFERR